MLDREKIIEQLSDKQTEVIVYDTVSSTNDLAKELCKEGKEKFLLLANAQTNGRGRQGKSFFSPKDSGLYFSLALGADSPDFDFTGVTCAVAVACTRAIEKLTALEPKIKWVNDIYIGNRKVCGILVQSVTENGRITKLIIGVGINISTENFPEEIKSIAGSLGEKIDRSILAAEIVNNIRELMSCRPCEYIGEYKAKSNVLGKEIIYFQNNIPHPARAVDIDEAGGLVVETNSEKITLISGEISLKVPL